MTEYQKKRRKVNNIKINRMRVHAGLYSTDRNEMKGGSPLDKVKIRGKIPFS